MTGDDITDSESRVIELSETLDFGNATSARRLSESNASTVNQSVTFDSFREVIEECMKGSDNAKDTKCAEYLGLNLGSFQVISLSAGLFISPKEPLIVVTLGEQIVVVLKYTIYIFIGLCLLLSIGGKVYAKSIGSDNVKAFGILFFSLYAWDFYSDIMFCVRLVDAKQWMLFVVGMLFIFVPWTMNLLQLFREQKKWTEDPLTKEKVSGWLVDWSIVLIVAVVISGNSFGAVELANSNLFAMDLFSMGLNPRNLKEFQAQRLFSSVMLENLPVEDFIFLHDPLINVIITQIYIAIGDSNIFSDNYWRI